VVRREGTWEIEQLHQQPLSLSAVTDKGSGGDVVPKPSDSLRRNRRRREEDASEASKGTEEGEETETDSLLPQQAAFEIMSPVRKHEGLYPGEGPVITELLLRSEPVDAPVSTLVREGVYLSRATQRLLRDALAQHSTHVLRQAWHSIRSSRRDDTSLPTDLSAALEKLQTPLSLRNPFADMKSQSTADNWQQVLRFSASFFERSHRSGLSFLLRSEESSGPCRRPYSSTPLTISRTDPAMRLLENWIDQRIQQQVHGSSLSSLSSQFHPPDPSSHDKKIFLGREHRPGDPTEVFFPWPHL
jgi:hypothetical protein